MAGENLFKRECKLVVYGPKTFSLQDLDNGTSSRDAKTFTGLRVKFRIKKTLEKELNTAEISIYNLSPASRAFLVSKGTPVALEAGYPGTTAIIFQGDSQTIDHVHEGPDWITTIKCGDGLQAYQFDRIAASFKAGIPKKEVFVAIAKKMSLDVKDAVLKAHKVGGQFPSGATLFGKASTELDKILKGTGLTWSIQDGKLQILDSVGSTDELPILLSASTGLIGSPSHSAPTHGADPSRPQKRPQVLKVKSLLQPGFRPGRRFTLDSRSVQKGDYVVQALEHQGDTHGPEWVSDLEAIPATQ